MEFQAEAAALSGAYADAVQPVVHGHQFGAVESGEVGVDAGLVAGLQIAPATPQAQRAAQLDFAAREDEMPARQWTHAIAELRAFARAQLDRLRQVLEIHAGGQVVEQRHALRLGEVVMQLQTHLAPAPQRQVAAELAFQAWRWQAPQPEGVEQGEQRHGNQQPPPEAAEQRRRMQAEGDGAAKQDRRGQ
ncbi:hypothetical protein D3C81_1047370 [compost metagenome]